MLLSYIQSFCIPIPLAQLKQGWDFASQLVPGADWTLGVGEQLAGPCPVSHLLSHSLICAIAGEIQAVSRPF